MKINLGKTPDELAAEEAKKQRELEAEIQRSMLERQQKVAALHRKQTTNKIIIFTISAIIIVVLLVFGTYNTFFKKGLTGDDINNYIYTALNPYRFPAEGLNNYVRDNSQALFDKYMDIDTSLYEYANVDKNSVYIFKVRRLSNTLAQVYFSADVEVKENDTPVTDQAIIEQLKRNGFGMKGEKKEESAAEQTDQVVPDPDADELASAEETASTEVEQSTSEESSNKKKKKSKENKEEATTEAPTTEDDSFANTNIEMANDSKSESIEYYMMSNGTIMQKGTTSTVRYNFYIPVELYYIYDGDTAVASGYKAAGEMTLYSLNEIDQTTFDEITVNDALKFNDDTLVEQDVLNSAQIEVDKTFSDLYNKRNTDHDFHNYRTFNTYDATYVGLTDFKMYSENNQLGYNAHVTYTIQTQQGFTYNIESYLIIEQNGNSWMISGIM